MSETLWLVAKFNLIFQDTLTSVFSIYLSFKPRTWISWDIQERLKGDEKLLVHGEEH